MTGKGEPWTAGELKDATEMWTNGVTSTVIAKKLGRTRNAVIGKMHREGADPPAKEHVFKKIRKVAYMPKPKPKVVSAEGVTLKELDYGMCKWPIREDKYCGQKSLEHRSYCDFHQKKSRKTAA